MSENNTRNVVWSGYKRINFKAGKFTGNFKGSRGSWKSDLELLYHHGLGYRWIVSRNKVKTFHLLFFLCCLFIVHFSIEIFRARFVWFLSTGWFFHQRSGCQTDQSFVLKQHLCFSTEKKKKRGKEKRQRKEESFCQQRRACSELLSWLRLKLVLYLASEKEKKKNEDKTRQQPPVLPVFSQPSSSLWSEQSSSPSHLHDNLTQRPVPQRNWSVVHMDVAEGDGDTNEEKNTHVQIHVTCFCDSDESGRNSLQFFSSDWSSQSYSPSHLQPALMHIPLLHMNSTDLQGWWEATHTNTHT